MTNFIESDCTFTHEGQSFTSGGAVATDDVLIAYPSDKFGNTGNGRELCDWHGNKIGEWWVVSSRRALFFGRMSWMGDKYYYMRARLTDGREYALRGFGSGMIARGKRIKSK